MIIRLEEEKDYLQVENLTREAFWNIYRPGCFEHFVLHNLRNDSCFVKELDYVIELDGKIIANIVYSKGTLQLKNGKKQEILLFGPVSVLPEYQKQGYGEKLINFTMKKAKELGFNEIVITGNPDYYKKYGFESASKYNIFYEGMDKNEESPFFMIYIFDKSKYSIDDAFYTDPDCFVSIDESELEKFDKNFPEKIKEKRPGQLV